VAADLIEMSGPKEEAEKNAKEMYKGDDLGYKLQMKYIQESFSFSKGL